MHGRRLGAEFGGDEKGNEKKLSNDLLGTNFHFMPKMSDDLFSSHPLLCDLTLFLTKNVYFRTKNFLLDTF